jgi:membrane protein required for colicin V production
MTAFDYVVLAIVGTSVLIALWRGLVREVVALAGWVAAIVLAVMASGEVAAALPVSWGSDVARYLIAFAGLFLLTLVLSALAGWLLSRAVKAIGLGFLDRLLGALFGLARGLLIVLVLALLAGLTTLPQTDWWRGAALAKPVETAAMAMRTWLPPQVAKRLSYPGDPPARTSASRKT